MRTLTDKELIHDRLGDVFLTATNPYDLHRRLEILIDQFLEDPMVKGKRVLDVGCGLGFFSERLTARGAKVTALDIGPQLVEKTRARAQCEAVQGDALHLIDRFGLAQFDLVLSSECIEHTPSPERAIRQMVGVLKPGGYLSFSTPNILWQPITRLATKLKLRPFDGLENFSSRGGLRRVLREEGVTILREEGAHLFPFQIPLHGLSRWCDRHLQSLTPLMINFCILGRREVGH